MLDVTFNNEDIQLDSFFKVLVFQEILDNIEDRNVRDLMLFICRKTIYFNKLDDRISMHQLQVNVGISRNILRRAIREATDNDYIEVDVSVGGKTESALKYSLFRLSSSFLSPIVSEWIKHKEENDFEY